MSDAGDAVAYAGLEEAARLERRREALRRAIELGLVIPMPEADREADRRMRLSGQPAGADLWVFGYGSLMWQPRFEALEAVPALAPGWHARFCLETPFGRGSPERPALMLALEPGGTCRGVAFLVAAADIEAVSDALWRREMSAGGYASRWVSVRPAGGAPVRAITFVADRASRRWAGRLTREEVIRRIATGEGVGGPNAEYLALTVRHLEGLGVRDGPLHRLHAEVERARA